MLWGDLELQPVAFLECDADAGAFGDEVSLVGVGFFILVGKSAGAEQGVIEYFA